MYDADITNETEGAKKIRLSESWLTWTIIGRFLHEMWFCYVRLVPWRMFVKYGVFVIGTLHHSKSNHRASWDDRALNWKEIEKWFGLVIREYAYNLEPNGWGSIRNVWTKSFEVLYGFSLSRWDQQALRLEARKREVMINEQKIHSRFHPMYVRTVASEYEWGGICFWRTFVPSYTVTNIFLCLWCWYEYSWAWSFKTDKPEDRSCPSCTFKQLSKRADTWELIGQR